MPLMPQAHAGLSAGSRKCPLCSGNSWRVPQSQCASRGNRHPPSPVASGFRAVSQGRGGWEPPRMGSSKRFLQQCMQNQEIPLLSPAPGMCLDETGACSVALASISLRILCSAPTAGPGASRGCFWGALLAASPSPEHPLGSTEGIPPPHPAEPQGQGMSRGPPFPTHQWGCAAPRARVTLSLPPGLCVVTHGSMGSATGAMGRAVPSGCLEAAGCWQCLGGIGVCESPAQEGFLPGTRPCMFWGTGGLQASPWAAAERGGASPPPAPPLPPPGSVCCESAQDGGTPARSCGGGTGGFLSWAGAEQTEQKGLS